MREEIWAIILAAGQGNRLKEASGGTAKQFLQHDGLPLFWHSASTIARLPRLDGIIFVFPEDTLAEAAKTIDELSKKNSLETTRQNFSTSRASSQGMAAGPLGIPHICVAGGPERQDSVWNGLNALPQACKHVLIHDSARPFVSAELCSRLADALADGHRGVIPGLEPSDTIKQVDAGGIVQATPPRSALRLVQTPQAFELDALVKAHKYGREHALKVTDDAALLEASGIPVLVIPGEAANIKITRPEDIAMLKQNNYAPAMLPCSGLGYDVHKYGGTRPLRLGGVLIGNTELAIEAHSDGDALLHALMDALLGCAAAGDIGEHFPDSNPQFDGANSTILLSEVLELVRKRGIILTHVDLTVVAQAPKISPYKKEIARNIAKLLHLNEQQVNMKASTEEGLGFTGAKEGIKAMALVTALRQV